MKNDVLCALPSYDGFIRAETAASLANMYVPDMYRMKTMTFEGYGIAHARNKMAQEALDGGYGYLLMVDSDVIVPEDGLGMLFSSLFNGCGNGVAVGYYPTSSEGETGKTCAYPDTGLEFKNPYHIHSIKSMKDAEKKDIPLRGTGLGFALIDVDVFKRIRKPWFKQRFDSEGIGLSEDMWFCNACRDKGIKIMLNTHAKCGHVVSRTL